MKNGLKISQKELKKRYYCTNPELVNHYFEQGKVSFSCQVITIIGMDGAES
jgi:hypothetical protein